MLLPSYVRLIVPRGELRKVAATLCESNLMIASIPELLAEIARRHPDEVALWRRGLLLADTETSSTGAMTWSIS